MGSVGAIFVGILGLCLCLCFVSVAESAPNTKVSNVLCNSGVFSEGDPFGTSLAYVLADLQVGTPASKGYSYRNISPYPNAFAYGQGHCNATLRSSDCRACLVAAKTAMLSSCVSRIGARSVLVDCSMRYEQYPFND